MRVDKFEWFMLIYHVCAQYICFYGLGVYFAGMGAVHNVISEGMRSNSKKIVYPDPSISGRFTGGKSVLFTAHSGGYESEI